MVSLQTLPADPPLLQYRPSALWSTPAPSVCRARCACCWCCFCFCFFLSARLSLGALNPENRRVDEREGKGVPTERHVSHVEKIPVCWNGDVP